MWVPNILTAALAFLLGWRCPSSPLFCQPLFCSFCVPGFSGGSDGKEFACNVGDLGLIPGLRRSPGEGNGNLLQYSCLESSMNRGAWQATVHGIA